MSGSPSPAEMTDAVLSLLPGVGLTLPSRLGGSRKLDSLELTVRTLLAPTLELRERERERRM